MAWYSSFLTVKISPISLGILSCLSTVYFKFWFNVILVDQSVLNTTKLSLFSTVNMFDQELLVSESMTMDSNCYSSNPVIVGFEPERKMIVLLWRTTGLPPDGTPLDTQWGHTTGASLCLVVVLHLRAVYVVNRMTQPSSSPRPLQHHGTWSSRGHALAENTTDNDIAPPRNSSRRIEFLWHSRVRHDGYLSHSLRFWESEWWWHDGRRRFC